MNSTTTYIIRNIDSDFDLAICNWQITFQSSLIFSAGASNEIHFLPVQERYIHALSRNTNCLTIDGQVCFYRRLFTDAVKPRGCISWSWGVLIGLHGVPNCSSRQSWPPLWIVSVQVTYWRYSTAIWVRIGALPRLRLPTRPPPIDSIRDITGAEKNNLKNQQQSSS